MTIDLSSGSGTLNINGNLNVTGTQTSTAQTDSVVTGDSSKTLLDTAKAPRDVAMEVIDGMDTTMFVNLIETLHIEYGMSLP